VHKQDFNDYLWLLALARERSFIRPHGQADAVDAEVDLGREATS
jgi:hypothetical protein